MENEPIDIDYMLSVREPFAHLLVTGIKKVENRSVAFPRELPLWVAIHTSQSDEGYADIEHITELMSRHPDIRRSWDKPMDWESLKDVPDHALPRMFGRSEIIGAVRFVASIPYGDEEFMKEPEEVFGQYGDAEQHAEFACGPHCWIADKAVRFRHPVVTTGMLGVRPMAPALAALVKATSTVLLDDCADSYSRPVIHKLPKLPKRELMMYRADED